jgi:hypothetical protein
MNVEVQVDPFAPLSPASPSPQELEAAWFDAPRPASRPPFPSARPSAPPPSIDDPVADPWFR